MAKTFNSVNAYIDDFPDQVASKLYELKACIIDAAPDASELFNYGIPAFNLVEINN